uniref:CAP-Gly domain-containing protein n=1 Tax=Timema monikensis TaxID=170555 RepID=A0A7R9HS27_9NEOP|nr:unnamed protein product [Timema monikensis]
MRPDGLGGKVNPLPGSCDKNNVITHALSTSNQLSWPGIRRFRFQYRLTFCSRRLLRIENSSPKPVTSPARRKLMSVHGPSAGTGGRLQPPKALPPRESAPGESRIPLFGASRIPARKTNNPSANHQDVAPDPPAIPKQRHLFQYGGVGSKKSLFKNLTLFKNLFGGGSLRRTKETLPTAADKPRTNDATFSVPESRVRDDRNRPIAARPSDDLESQADDVFQSPSARHKDWTYLVDGSSSNPLDLRMSHNDASGAEGNGRETGTSIIEQRSSHASRPRSRPHDVSPPCKTDDNLLVLAKRSSDILDDPTFTDLAFDNPSATSSPLVELPLVGPSMVGQRVRVGGRKRGTLMYYGPIQCDAGVFCGVELDEPEGLNDGSLKGVRYFQCRPNHGIIAPVDKVALFPASAASTTNHRLRKDTYVSDQPCGPASILGDVTTTRQTQEEDLEQPCLSKKRPGLFLPSTDQHQSQGSSEVSTPTPGSSTSGGATAMEWSSSPSKKTIFFPQMQTTQSHETLSKHSSFEMDDSLDILTSECLLSPGILTSGCLSSPGILTSECLSSPGILTSECLSSPGILSPDQMPDFTLLLDPAPSVKPPSEARSSDPFARYKGGGEEFPWSKYFEQSSNFSLLDDQVLPYHDTLERLDGCDVLMSCSGEPSLEAGIKVRILEYMR